MSDFDSMTHEELAKAADQLREAKYLAGVGGDMGRQAELEAELELLGESARKRPQQLTGSGEIVIPIPRVEGF